MPRRSVERTPRLPPSRACLRVSLGTPVAAASQRFVRDASELESALADFGGVPLMQEFIEGDDLELTILAGHGDPIAGSAYLMLRNRPPYGPPCACRTIRDDALMDIGKRLLRGLNYHGVAHLDFRRDRRDGQPKLLDFNTRLAGSNEISTQTGVDFALMMYRMALGEPVEPCFDYEIGTELRWPMFGELVHLTRTPKKREALARWLRWRGVRTDLSLRDPTPHLIKGLNLMMKPIERR